MGDIIRHSVEGTRVVKDGRGEQGPTVHFHSDAKKICQNRVNGRIFLEAPADCGSVVAACPGYVPGMAQAGKGKQDFFNNSAASFKSELVVPPVGFSQVTRSATISSGHRKRKKKFFSEPLGSIHTPPAPTPKVSQKPRAVGKR